jgi:hypothetical protein
MFNTENYNFPDHIAVSCYLLEKFTHTLSCRLVQRVYTLCNVKIGDPQLPTKFMAGVTVDREEMLSKKIEGLPLPLKGQ